MISRRAVLGGSTVVLVSALKTAATAGQSGRWIDADSERAVITANVRRGKVDATWLQAWLTNNQKNGILVTEIPPPPSIFIEPYPNRQLTIAQVLSILPAAGFVAKDQRLTVLAIGIAESGLHTAARNVHPEYGGAADRGIWQISAHSWPQYSDLSCDTPTLAADIVFALSNGGTNFTPWDTFKSGAAQRHYDTAFDGWPALRPLVT